MGMLIGIKHHWTLILLLICKWWMILLRSSHHFQVFMWWVSLCLQLGIWFPYLVIILKVSRALIHNLCKVSKSRICQVRRVLIFVLWNLREGFVDFRNYIRLILLILLINAGFKRLLETPLSLCGSNQRLLLVAKKVRARFLRSLIFSLVFQSWTLVIEIMTWV